MKASEVRLSKQGKFLYWDAGDSYRGIIVFHEDFDLDQFGVSVTSGMLKIHFNERVIKIVNIRAYDDWYRWSSKTMRMGEGTSIPPKLGERMLLLILTKEERVNIPGDLNQSLRHWNTHATFNS